MQFNLLITALSCLFCACARARLAVLGLEIKLVKPWKSEVNIIIYVVIIILTREQRAGHSTHPCLPKRKEHKPSFKRSRDTKIIPFWVYEFLLALIPVALDSHQESLQHVLGTLGVTVQDHHLGNHCSVTSHLPMSTSSPSA